MTEYILDCGSSLSRPVRFDLYKSLVLSNELINVELPPLKILRKGQKTGLVKLAYFHRSRGVEVAFG